MAGCGPDPVVATPFDDIETRTWGGCPTGFEVVLTTVLGGGHTWPGATLDLSADADAPAGQAEFLEGFDFAAVAGHQIRNIEAPGMILDFFDAHAGESS
jgi:poly(3-hydroxybutyrate) depolymerase